MAKAILRFSKHKGNPACKMQAHHEREKQKYNSNPDIKLEKSCQNIHLITPKMTYKREIDSRISDAKCKTRKDSVRFIDTLITVSTEFFEDKNDEEIIEFFKHGLDFIKKSIAPENIFSAVIHLDEKTPHMHLCFVPLTKDNRLCAKEIIGNSTKLVKWQDKFYEHMVEFYPTLERGEPARETQRKHIPTSIFKAACKLQKMQLEIESILESTNILNSSKNTAKVKNIIKKFVPKVESFETQVSMLSKSFKKSQEENFALSQTLSEYKDKSFLQSMELAGLRSEVDDLLRFLDKIPDDVIEKVKRDERERRKMMDREEER